MGFGRFMRLLAFVLITLLAGCLGPNHSNGVFAHDDRAALDGRPSAEEATASADPDDAQPDGGLAAEHNGGSASGESASQPPPPIHRESQYTFGFDPLSTQGQPCDGPVLNNCDEPTFHLNGTFGVEATLTWMTPGNDLDLYLYRGDTQVSADGVNDEPDLFGTHQILHHHDLPPGDYSVWVTVRHGVLGQYTLDLVFS